MNDTVENPTAEDKDNFFIHVCFEALKNRISRSVVPALLFIIYISFRLIFRGNATIFFLTYKQILFCSIATIVTLFLYGYTVITHLHDYINKRIVVSLNKILTTILEGISQFFTYGVLLFYLYCVIFVGIKSLSDFEYGFTIFPIMKLIVFSMIGLYGLMPVIQLLKLGKMLSENKASLHDDTLRGFLQYGIIEYIFKNKLYDEKKFNK